MWFGVIKYAIEHNNMDWIDLGGCDGTWPEVVKNREKWPNNKYKWMYIAREVRENPEKQPNLILERPEGALGNLKYLKKVWSMII